MDSLAHETTPLLGRHAKHDRHLNGVQLLALVRFLLALIVCVAGHFLPFALRHYTSIDDVWDKIITIAIPHILDSLWDYEVKPGLDSMAFEALRKIPTNAVDVTQRDIRKSDAPSAFLKGCLLKVPSIIAMSAMNLGKQMGLPCAGLVSVVVAAVLAFGFYFVFSPRARLAQNAKAARDDAT
ncbi:hypothetical protein ACHAQH_009179, partial [Verticillium albo-atrum]